MKRRKGETKKRRKWPWTRLMKRNERRAKLKVGDLVHSALHLDKMGTSKHPP
jgi:hypothetical protein